VAQTLYFGNKSTTIPGVYTEFISGINNQPVQASFGNILIIDTGTGAGFTGGAGISGTLESNINSIQEFDSLNQYTDAIRGSELFILGEALFQPQGAGNAPGVPKVYFAKAASTAPATISYTFTGGGANGGVFTVQVRDEGTVGNGVEVSSVLTRGYAGVMRAGTIDTAKFAIDFFRGTFKGLDGDSEPWDFVAEANTQPELLVSSVEFDNISDLINWANNDSTFQRYFNVSVGTITGTGAVDAADLAANTGNTLASGGSESYSTTELDNVLDNIADLDYTFVLALDNANDATSTDNSKILTHLTDEARFRKFMIVGGADDDTLTGTNSSSAAAAFYDSPRVTVVHSGVKLVRRGSSGFKTRSSLYKASLVLGKLAGQAPQVPLTFKSLKMDRDVHELNKTEKETALANGVLATVFDADFQGYIVLQGINSKQSNTFTIDDDATSFEISIESIKAQISKELEINGKVLLLGQSNGVNRNTLADVDVKQFTESYLTSREATTNEDDLITKSGNVTVETIGDTYAVSYSFVPSFPLNKILFRGVILDEINL